MMTMVRDLKEGDVFFSKQCQRWYVHQGDDHLFPDRRIHVEQLRKNGQRSGNHYYIYKDDVVRTFSD